MSSMVTNGVQSVRVAFDWSAAQPYASFSDVPADKRSNSSPARPGARSASTPPMRWSATRPGAGSASCPRSSMRRVGTPSATPAVVWSRRRMSRPTPSTRRRWCSATDRRAASGRPTLSSARGRSGCGRSGTSPTSRSTGPSRSARATSRCSEPPTTRSSAPIPKAKVVLGALTNFAWKSIDQVYAVSGASKLFDLVAVNGFTQHPANVHPVPAVHARTRWITSRTGASRCWTRSSAGLRRRGQAQQHYDFSTTRKGQAADISSFMT